MRMTMSPADVREALLAAAIGRKVEKVTGGVTIKMAGKGSAVKDAYAQVEVAPVDFDIAATADACKAWMLAKPRNMVVMGAIEFHEDAAGEIVAACDVEAKARKQRAAKV